MLPAATTATAAYNADNQLTSWNGTTIAYDLNGNLTSDGTRSFTWDARNRLTGITGVASFVYDGVGRRQSATQGATTTTALYDGYDPVQCQRQPVPVRRRPERRHRAHLLPRGSLPKNIK